MTGYSNIAVYYTTLFSLVQHHKYSLTEVYEMYPYERDLFAELLINSGANINLGNIGLLLLNQE